LTTLRFLFRVDASTEIGTGHVTRCITLAKKLRTYGHTCEFACRLHVGNLVDHIESQGFYVLRLLKPTPNEVCPSLELSTRHASWLGVSQIADCNELLGLIGEGKYDWVVIDHYGIDTVWEQMMRSCCNQILVIDDLANRSHDCDVLLDQNFVGNYLSRYDGLVPDGCNKLLGPRYALLHADFETVIKDPGSKTNAPRRALVFFGGTDVGGVTATVVNAIMEIDDLDFHLEIVLNKESPSYESIASKWSQSMRLTFHSGLPSLANLMSRCDVAIGAGGVTTWERLCTALPSLIFTVADNQVAIAEYLQSQGLVSYCGKFGEARKESIVRSFRALVQQESRPDFIQKCHALVPGNGTNTVATYIGIPHFVELCVRTANAEDVNLIFEWANDPYVRKNSLNGDSIPFEVHQKWYSEKIACPATKLYIIENDSGVSVGVVRLEQKSERWLLNYNIAPILRGKGLARGMLSAALTYHRDVVGCCTVGATVKVENVASRRVLERESFVQVQLNSDVVEYELTVK